MSSNIYLPVYPKMMEPSSTVIDIPEEYGGEIPQKKVSFFQKHKKNIIIFTIIVVIVVCIFFYFYKSKKESLDQKEGPPNNPQKIDMDEALKYREKRKKENQPEKDTTQENPNKSEVQIQVNPPTKPNVQVQPQNDAFVVESIIVVDCVPPLSKTDIIPNSEPGKIIELPDELEDKEDKKPEIESMIDNIISK